jgi:hypothetical protein
MKKETLEEAAKYYAHNYFEMHDTNNYKALKQGFEAGAKWQQEKMYSEEDMRKAFKSSSLTNMLDVYESFEEFIEQFKNK